MLLQAGAHVDARDSSGVTPLLRASERGAAAAVRLLVDARAHVDVVGNDGRSGVWVSACDTCVSMACLRLTSVSVACVRNVRVPTCI